MVNWAVAVKDEYDVVANSLEVDGYFQIPSNAYFCANTSRKDNLSLVGASIANSIPGRVLLIGVESRNLVLFCDNVGVVDIFLFHNYGGITVNIKLLSLAGWLRQ